MRDEPAPTLRISPDVAHRDIEGQILLLLPGGHHLYTLNESGQVIWEGLRARRGVARIVADVAAHFDISRADAERDVLGFLSELKAQGIVQEVVPGKRAVR